VMRPSPHPQRDSDALSVQSVCSPR